ncbi:MAG: flagellar export protein FliJ [Gammaproteobacteria bacterium]|nr:flagellar export protein FliJ [Gammaproteobacteria bacterium]MBU1441113.1 flagellar export protein FliJ [Gammaproteobacteria bacterium]
MSVMNGLSVAVELAQTRRDAAAQVLAKARQQWISAQLQIDQLESYAQECTTRWAQQSLSCTPELMRHHYQFMARLDHAIGLQTGIVAEHGRNVEREAATLRVAELKLESLRQLMKQRERERQAELSRREQKMSDEQAAIQHRRRASAFSGGVR